jgi:4-amino-4-deoxy-L-arabinose transferase-like glycosyltransferase
VTLRDCALVVALGLATLLPFVGQTRDVGTHELRHAEIAREMADSGELLVPTLLGREYVDKPPVMHAMIAGLYRLAGDPSLALARLPSIVAGVLGALALYGIALVLSGREPALLAALALPATLEYHRMARIARPDMIFVAAILAACFAVAAALRAAGSGRRFSRLALAGAASGVATVTKGPLGAVVPALVAMLAPIRRRDLGRLRGREWLTFGAGLALVVAFWVVPLLLTGHRDYLHRVLVQPDLSGGQVEPGPRYMYVHALLVGLLPLTVLLPLVVHDVRRRGYTAPVAIAIALLVLLVIYPKKRAHYLLPVYPFLVLAVAEAVVRATETRWIRRATTGIVVASLIAGPLYYAITPPWPVSEEPKLVMTRRVLSLVDPGRSIVCLDELAEAIAFEGRRGGVSHLDAVGDVIRAARTNGEGSYIALPDGFGEELERAATGRLDLVHVLSAEIPLHRRTRGWQLYRVAGVIG